MIGDQFLTLQFSTLAFVIPEYMKGVVARNPFELNLVKRIFFPG